jgi:hypothetical protein
MEVIFTETFLSGFYLFENAYHCNILSIWSSTFCKWQAAQEPSSSRVVVTPAMYHRLSLPAWYYDEGKIHIIYIDCILVTTKSHVVIYIQYFLNSVQTSCFSRRPFLMSGLG